MIKNLFIKFGLWLAQDEIQKIKFEANSKAELKETEREKSKLIIQEYEVEYVMGKKIIYCSNEWSDPGFGTVVGLEYHTGGDVLMLKCKNALYGHPGFMNTEEFFYVMLGTYLIADELMTNAVLKLNPFERWNLTTGKSISVSNLWTKWYPEKKELFHPFVLEKALREVGFMLPLSAGEKLISMGQLSSPTSVFEFSVTKEKKVIRYRRKDDLTKTRVNSIKLNTDEQFQEVITILGLKENNEEQSA